MQKSMDSTSYDKAWKGFKGDKWKRNVTVRDFIQLNYKPYDGDDTFLEGPTENTAQLWDQVMDLDRKEIEAGGVLDMDTDIVSSITSHGPGYLDKDKETVVRSEEHTSELQSRGH